MRGMRLGLLLVMACGGASTVVERPRDEPDAGVSPDTEPFPDAAVRVAVSAEVGAAAALEAMFAALVDEELPAWVVSDFALNPDERIDGVVGLSEARGREAIESLRVELGFHDAVPESLRELLRAWATAELAALVCSRRQELGGDPCVEEDPRQEDVRDDAIASALAGYLVGEARAVPVREGRALVPVALPSLGLPLVATFDDHEALEVELRDGTVIFPVQRWPTDESGAYRALVVTLDPAALGGVLAPAALPQTRVVAREVDARSFVVAVRERRRGSDTRADDAENELAAALGEHAGRPAHALDARARRTLRRMDVDRLARGIPELASNAAGAMDVVVAGEVQTEFAGRAGPTRVWFSAGGTVRVYDAFSGEVLAEVEHEVRAIGVSEDRAESAARQELVGELARLVAERLGWQ